MTLAYVVRWKVQPLQLCIISHLCLVLRIIAEQILESMSL
jgi:hypothetical protein